MFAYRSASPRLPVAAGQPLLAAASPSTPLFFFEHVIEPEFSDFPVSALGDKRTRGVFLEWRDKLALKSRRRDRRFSRAALSHQLSCRQTRSGLRSALVQPWRARIGCLTSHGFPGFLDLSGNRLRSSVKTPLSKNFAADATVPAIAVPVLPRWVAFSLAYIKESAIKPGRPYAICGTAYRVA